MYFSYKYNKVCACVCEREFLTQIDEIIQMSKSKLVLLWEILSTYRKMICKLVNVRLSELLMVKLVIQITSEKQGN